MDFLREILKDVSFFVVKCYNKKALTKGGGKVMPQALKSSLRRQKRVLRFHFLIHGLYKNLRVDHHFDDY